MLSPYRFPALYAAQHLRQLEDLDFYLRFCGQSVLELGCGTGRLSFPLVEQGHYLTGVDIDSDMLAYANDVLLAKNADVQSRLKFLQDDIRNLTIDDKFDTIIFPYNSIGHILPGEEVRQLAASIAAHLRGDGCCIISLLQPDNELCLPESDLRLLEQFIGPDGEIVDCYERTSWQPEENRLVFDWYYEQNSMDEMLHLRNDLYLHSGDSLVSDFLSEGLVLHARYGDFDGNPWHPDSPELLQLYRLA